MILKLSKNERPLVPSLSVIRGAVRVRPGHFAAHVQRREKSRRTPANERRKLRRMSLAVSGAALGQFQEGQSSSSSQTSWWPTLQRLPALHQVAVQVHVPDDSTTLSTGTLLMTVTTMTRLFHDMVRAMASAVSFPVNPVIILKTALVS